MRHGRFQGCRTGCSTRPARVPNGRQTRHNCPRRGSSPRPQSSLDRIGFELRPPIAGTTAATGKTADADRFVVRGTIPIAAVAAGDYVVRARVNVSGTVVATVTRTLRK